MGKLQELSDPAKLENIKADPKKYRKELCGKPVLRHFDTLASKHALKKAERQNDEALGAK